MFEDTKQDPIFPAFCTKMYQSKRNYLLVMPKYKDYQMIIDVYVYFLQCSRTKLYVFSKLNENKNLAIS